jgi:hypothetical protein
MMAGREEGNICMRMHAKLIEMERKTIEKWHVGEIGEGNEKDRKKIQMLDTRMK